MAYLLFPGRHLINTSFQERYLTDLLKSPIEKMKFLGELKIPPNEKINEIIFAVTSANQSRSRYNPIPFWARAISIDRFARQFKETFKVHYRIIGIPHYPPTSTFADLILKEIRESTPDNLSLTPENTIILCSTPGLIELYIKLGFAVLSAEYDYAEKRHKEKTPIDIIKDVFDKKIRWENSSEFKNGVSKSSFEVWEDFADIPSAIKRIWEDPILTESGSLTKERNYSTYAAGMGHTELINLKYNDVKKAIAPGKIVDEGCADGALIAQIAKDFPDSDIIGIEITSEFIARCLERQRAGEFGGTFVHFHQRNLFDKIFEDNSIDCTICNSTTHEIWSYGRGKESLSEYIEKKFVQLRPGGRLIIRDVVGPENKEIEIWLKANQQDGLNEDIFKNFETNEELARHLKNLSTHARFKRFAEDFLKDMRESGKRGPETKIKYREETIDGIPYFITSLKNAVEFMTKKDYTDNWESELNEEFAFMSFGEWKKFLSDRGFRIIENPNESTKSSRVYSNQWIVENRFRNKTDLFIKTKNSIEKIEYPVTNMVLIGEKSE